MHKRELSLVYQHAVFGIGTGRRGPDTDMRRAKGFQFEDRGKHEGCVNLSCWQFKNKLFGVRKEEHKIRRDKD